MQEYVKKILLIEDDEAINDILQEILTEAGYTIILADERKDIPAQVASLRPDLVLMDLHYKGLVMANVVKELKNSKTSRSIAVVLFSADQDVETIARQSKADGFIKKPFVLEDFFHSLEKILKRDDTER